MQSINANSNEKIYSLRCKSTMFYSYFLAANYLPFMDIHLKVVANKFLKLSQHHSIKAIMFHTHIYIYINIYK